VTAAPGLALKWWREGEAAFSATVDGLTDDELAVASPLPGWTRTTIIAHVARNADALVNLLAWARTGIEAPMYASPASRDADIATTAALPPAALRADPIDARTRLADAVEQLSETAWVAQVRTAQGRIIPAHEVVWMRDREVWVHAVDLGATTSVWPEELAVALIDDVLAMFTRREQTPEVTLVAGERTWGSGSIVIRASVTETAAWLTGRGPAPTADAPRLPGWL